jgi:hypothetical protein
MGWLNSGPSARLACDISSFAPVMVTGDAIYKDGTGQVYFKFRDDIGLSPDYWFAPDDTGKPIVPPPPVKASIHATYDYFGFPWTVAGQCWGQDN